MTRQELSAKSGISDGGGLTKVLTELEACALIGRSFDITKRKNGGYFKLIDFYSLFYFKYLSARKNTDPHFWTNYLTDSAHRAWCGYAFERLCAAHIQQIKYKLGIAGVTTEIYAFRSKEKKGGVQIDLLIERKDSIINLCECKFTNKLLSLTEKDIAALEQKRDVFVKETGTKKAIHMTMITANGLVQNAYRNEIHSEITLDDLFLPIN